MRAFAAGVSTLALMTLAACATTDAIDPAEVAGTEPADAARADASKPYVFDPARETAVIKAPNPLLAEWSGPYGGVPPWEHLNPEHFPNAFEVGIAELLIDIDRIATSRDAPTFANTVAAMEDSGRTLDRVNSMFGVATSNISNAQYQALDQEWSPKLTAAYNKVTFNPALFARVETVYRARQTAGLTPEQLRLTERTYDGFVRQGAKLTEAQKAEVGKISEELSKLFAEFNAKVLADEGTFITVADEAKLAGLPDALKAGYRAAAEERKLPGGSYAIVNTRSAVDPFLAFASDRSLREQVWKAFKNRGANADGENTAATIARITELRAQRAKLLGFATHAHYRMDDTMAKDPAKAQALMMRVWTPAVARVKEEVRDMSAIARRDNVATFEPWDYLFYAEKVRKARYDLDQNEVKPYLTLDNMQLAAFHTAGELYGLTFTPVTGVPVFAEGVKVYEVKEANGDSLGLFYADNFARTGKRSGAWMTTYRVREGFKGEPTNVLASNNNNFVPGTAGEPVLISQDDAETLFHEFGHALHYLMSEATYPGLTQTPRDYVEYPSQVMEHWVLTRPILDKFAKHYRTGEPMPQALVDKIAASSKFNQGYATVEYLSSALVDMAMHNRPTGVADPVAFERDTLASLGMPRELAMRHRLPQFGHLFSSDGYSAGYYSYLWSEVMDADTWAAFEESGDVFNPELAAKMREYILAPGNTSDRAAAFRAFRGRDPDVTALLKVRGFPTGEGAR